MAYSRYRKNDIVVLKSFNEGDSVHGYYMYGVYVDHFSGEKVKITSLYPYSEFDEMCFENEEGKTLWCTNEIIDCFASEKENPEAMANFLRNGNIVVFDDGKEMLCTDNSFRSAKGFSVKKSKYLDANRYYADKNIENEKYDIKAIYAPSDGNYLFNKGNLIWQAGGVV